MVYPIAKLTLAPFISLFIKGVDGIENLPKNSAFIIAANHQSFFDDLALPCLVVPYLDKRVHFYANRIFFKNFFLRKFLNWSSSIPVAVDKKLDSKHVNENAFKKAMGFIENGGIVGIFPEGHRSEDGKLKEARTGVARLAIAAGVPVVPIGIIGSYKILPKGKMLPRLKRCRVRIGKPIYLNGYSSFDKDTLKKATKQIMENIAQLIGQKYEYV